MKIKLIDLNEAQPALHALSNTKLPVKVAYRVSRAINCVVTVMQAHEKFRITLLNKYGVLDTKANNYSFPVDGNEAMYQADMDAAGNAEVVIDGLAGIALADLDGCMLAKIGAVSELELVEKKEG